MAHKRNIAPSHPLEGDALTRAMTGIGMAFATEPDRDANIEDTLVAASMEGMERDDLRVLSVLVTWLGVHSMWINADRLVHLIDISPSVRLKAFWSAIAAWQGTDHRFARLLKLHKGPPIELLRVGTAFQLRRNGEDDRFAGSALRVPGNVLRRRAQDVLPPAEVARIHSAYRWRVIIGPTYRADMWSTIEKDPSLTASELARRTYGSFATAWRVKSDFSVLSIARVATTSRRRLKSKNAG